MKYELVIKNGMLINSQETFLSDIAINGSKISAIGQGLKGENEIDAKGKYVLPGAIDGHVHLADYTTPEPWVPTADCFRTGSIAAAIGGVTTVIDFAESKAELSLLEALENRKKDAEGKSVIDYSFHINMRDVEPHRVSEISELFEQGICSFKFFMAFEGYRLTDDLLHRAMKAVSNHNGLAIVHAENHDIIKELTRSYSKAGKTGPKWYTKLHPTIIEGEAVNRALAIANISNVRLLIFHMSCLEAVNALKQAKEKGQIAFGEVCPQHLLISEEAYQRDNSSAHTLMVRPPLRDENNQKTLWKAIKSGSIDIVSTDHNPRVFREGSEYSFKTTGTASIETRLSQLYYFGVSKGKLSLNRWVDLCCSKPANIFGLQNKGQLLPGFDADIVIFNPDKKVRFSSSTLHSAIDFCTYEGMEVTGFPEITISRGEVIAKDSEYIGKPGRGHFIQRFYN